MNSILFPNTKPTLGFSLVRVCHEVINQGKGMKRSTFCDPTHRMHSIPNKLQCQSTVGTIFIHRRLRAEPPEASSTTGTSLQTLSASFLVISTTGSPPRTRARQHIPALSRHPGRHRGTCCRGPVGRGRPPTQCTCAVVWRGRCH